MAPDGSVYSTLFDARVALLLDRFLMELRRGFFAMCNQRLVSVFSVAEIDVDDWRRHTSFDAPYHAAHRIVKNLWAP